MRFVTYARTSTTVARMGDYWCSAYAFVLACIVTAWLRFLGTIDYEEHVTFGYLFGQDQTTSFLTRETSEIGLSRLLYIPQFDFRSAIGIRLPLAGSWTQSPYIFLRQNISTQFFYLLRSFVPTFFMLLALNHTIRLLSSRGKYSWRVIIVSICAFGHVGIFGRYTDWSAAASFNSAVVSLVCTIICITSTRSEANQSISSWMPLVAVYSAIEIATGHPGYVFFSLIMTVSVWLVGVYTRRSDGVKHRSTVLRGDVLLLAIVTCILAINLLVTFVDLTTAFEGIPASSTAQTLALGGSIVTKLLFGAFAPLIWLAYTILGESPVAYPRAYFPLLTAAPILAALRRARSKLFSNASPIDVFLIPTLLVLTYAYLQDWSVLPPVLRTSGTWITSGATRTFLVLGLLVTLSQVPRREVRFLRVCSLITVMLAVNYSLTMLALIPDPLGEVRAFSIPSQSQSLTGPELDDFHKIMPRSGRIIASSSPASADSAFQFLKLRDHGYQVVAPTFIKNRSLRPLAARPASNGTIVPSPTEIEASMRLNNGRTLDFLNVEKVFFEDGLTEPETGVTLGLQRDTGTVVSGGITFQAYGNTKFSSFYFRTQDSELSSECWLLQGKCMPLINARSGPARSTPRYRLCTHVCMARFDFEVAEYGEQSRLLLPVAYDPTIVASIDGASISLRTENTAGLLVVSVGDMRSGTINLNIRPDHTMFGRTFLAYINTIALVIAGVYGLSLRDSRAIRLPTKTHA